jgi:hypothetical protein
MRRVGFSCVLSALVGVSTTARAADDALALSWSAPTDCPGGDAIKAGVERILASSRVREPLRARGIVSRAAAGGFHGEVEISASGQSSTRSVDGESCAAVSDAMELMLAIAINPDALPSPPASPVAATREAPPAEPARPARGTLFVLAASGLIGSGSFGAAAPGAELAAGFAWRRLVLEANGAWLAARHATLADKPSEGASAWTAHAGARACVFLTGRALDVAPCAGVGVEWIVAHGFGASEPADATATLVVPALGVRATLAISQAISLRAGGEAALPLDRPSFVIDNAGTVERVSAAMFRATAGAECHF